jgi:hypothetical protein
MPRHFLVLCAVAWQLSAAVTVVDRIVAVVGQHAIKQSDIDRDLRITQFLNQEPVDAGVGARKKALERLIDQELIRADMSMSGNSSRFETEAKELLAQLLRDRFGGAKPPFEAELRRRDLREAQLLQQLQWQLAVLRFIDDRFRPGVLISDEQVRAYYDQHLTELSRTQSDHSFEALAPKIRETLAGEEVNRNFEEWLAQARKGTVIQYKVESLK